MNRIRLAGAAALLVAGTAWAQSGAYRTFGSSHGFGNILAPGVGNLPPITANSGASSFAGRFGGIIGGYPGYSGAPVGRGGPRGGRGAVAVPYPVPVWVGGYGWDAPYPYQQAPVAPVAPQVVSPPVIINQYYTADTARPVTREYSPGSLPEPESGRMRIQSAPSGPSFPAPDEQKATIWLIAFKDGTIYPALGFWLEGDTLHYITKDSSHNRASVDRIDREFTEQLNRERGLDFKLTR